MDISHSALDLDNLKDPVWRLNHLYYITNKDKKKVRFNLNGVQAMLQANDSRFNVTLKARQLGVSTYWLLKYLDIAAFNKNQTIAILSHDWESLRKLFKIIRFAHKNMHPLIRPEIDRGGGSKYRLFFPDINSEIYCTLEAVSDAVSHLHISEMALMDDPDRVRTSMDAVPIHTGRISIETTARGFNHFHEFWSGESGYKKFFFPWYLHDEYQMAHDGSSFTEQENDLVKKAKRLFSIDITPEQIAFRRFKIAQKKSVNAFLQEYPEDDATCFISSGTPAFDVMKINDLTKHTRDPIRQNDIMKLFAEPINGHQYVCGVDTSEGVGNDSSVAIIMDAKTLDVVAKLKSDKLKPFDFAHEVHDLCKYFKRGGAPFPLLAVERNNHGHAVLLELGKDHLDYPNLYTHKDDRPGWITDRVTRPIMLDTFIDSVESNHISIPDIDILSECLTLINNEGKIEAADKKHDDCVIATSIALQMAIKFKELDIYHDIENRILL